MKIATWNVNSVRVREARLTAFLAREQPDVLCLQELKVEDDDFPKDAVRAAGYEAATFGQKTYNGVAILAKRGLPLENVSRTLRGWRRRPPGESDRRRRHGRAGGVDLRAQRRRGGLGEVGLQAVLAEATPRLRLSKARSEREGGDLRRHQHRPRSPGRGQARPLEEQRPLPSGDDRGVSGSPGSRSRGHRAPPPSRARGPSPGGTIGCWLSRRAMACASTTSSLPRLWPRPAPRSAWIGTSARAKSPPITRPSSPSSAEGLDRVSSYSSQGSGLSTGLLKPPLSTPVP